jgi:xylan 1,4-beta-xylosidase
MNLRPDGSNPGQTYKWYTGTPVYEFGTGLFYTNFSISPASTPKGSTPAYDIPSLLSKSHPAYPYIELVPFLNFTVTVTNTGSTASDYSSMLFANTSTAGPAPYPNKWLVGFDRLSSIAPGASAKMTIPVAIGAVSRVDELGNAVLYPGRYELALNNEREAVMAFTLTGNATMLAKWPLAEQQIPSGTAK